MAVDQQKKEQHELFDLFWPKGQAQVSKGDTPAIVATKVTANAIHQEILAPRWESLLQCRKEKGDIHIKSCQREFNAWETRRQRIENHTNTTCGDFYLKMYFGFHADDSEMQKSAVLDYAQCMDYHSLPRVKNQERASGGFRFPFFAIANQNKSDH